MKCSATSSFATAMQPFRLGKSYFAGLALFAKRSIHAATRRIRNQSENFDKSIPSSSNRFRDTNTGLARISTFSASSSSIWMSAGQYSSSWDRNAGPENHPHDVKVSGSSTPWVSMSAGFSSPGMCHHCSGLVKVTISDDILATRTFIRCLTLLMY